MSYDIFISYRREGGDTLAQLIYDRLTDRGYRVFLDIESLRSGKFNEKLFSVIEECKDVVVILPPDALERCNNEEDWLYLEMSHAIRNRKNVIPIMMKGFFWPDELPEALRELPDFNGIQDSKDYFDAVIDKLTSLLHSKPALFGKFRKSNKKNDFKEQIARRKKIILTVFCILFTAAAGIMAVHWKKREKIREMADNVSIILTASDEMNASEYYDAIDILKERISIFAGDSKYSLDIHNDEIDISIPLKKFDRTDVQEYLRCYLSRAIKLYLHDSDSDETMEIQRSDIKNLEYLRGSIEGLDPDEFFPSYVLEETASLSDMGEYYYFEITFTDEFQQKIREKFGTNSGSLILSQDVESNPDKYYYYQLFSGKDGTFYFADYHQDDTTAALIQHNYTTEPMEGSFYVNILLPVEWEYTAETGEYGANQCDEDQITGPQVILQYDVVSTDVTEGNDRDALAAFRKRLDALGTPYAMGHTVSTDHGVTVKMAPDLLNNQIVNMIGSSFNPVSLENKFYPSVTVDKNAFSYDQENGIYTIEVSLNKFELDSWKNVLKQIGKSQCTDFYLTVGNLPVARCTPEAAQVSLDTGMLYFDNLFVWGIDVLTEEYGYLLDFLQELISGEKMPVAFSLEGARLVNVENADHVFGLQSVIEKRQEELQEKILQVCPTARISVDDSGYLKVWLELETNDSMPEDSIALIKQIYEMVDFENDVCYKNLYVRCDAQNNIGFFFRVDQYGTHTVTCEYLFNSDSFKQEYGEQFRQLVENDPFFTGIM